MAGRTVQPDEVRSEHGENGGLGRRLSALPRSGDALDAAVEPCGRFELVLAAHMPDGISRYAREERMVRRRRSKAAPGLNLRFAIKSKFVLTFLVCYVTLRYVTLEDGMPAGASGRIVIDIDPATKRQIYSALKSRGLTMREWLLSMSHGDLGVRPDGVHGDKPPTPSFASVSHSQGKTR